MHPLADGNDMGGSLRLPAGYCNVIGLRPSAGRVPVYPATDGYAGLSVQGPMARTVDDIALLLSVMAGPDRRSPISLEEPGASFAQVGEGSLAGLRIAFSPDLDGAVGGGERGRRLGVGGRRELRDARRRRGAGQPRLRRCRRVLPHPAGLAVRGHPRRGPRRERADHPAQPVREHAGRPRADRARTSAGPWCCAPRCSTGCGSSWTPIDALILPVAPLPAFDADLQYPPVVAGLQQPDYLGWMRTVCHVTVTGHPVISMPAGFTAAGTPLGVQIVGRHRAERELLAIAKGFETATGYASTASGRSTERCSGVTTRTGLELRWCGWRLT